MDNVIQFESDDSAHKPSHPYQELNSYKDTEQSNHRHSSKPHHKMNGSVANIDEYNDLLEPAEVLDVPLRDIQVQKLNTQDTFYKTLTTLRQGSTINFADTFRNDKFIAYPINTWSVEQCKKMIEQDPNCAEGYFQQALLYLQEEDTFKAKKCLQKVYQLDPKYEASTVNSILGNFYFEEKDYTNALHHYNEAVVDSDQKCLLYMTIAKCYAKLKVTELAEKAYKKAISSDNKYFLPYYKLGKHYLKNHCRKEGIDALMKAQTLEPDDMEIIQQLGAALLSVDNDKFYTEEAVSVYKRGLELDPNHLECMTQLAKSYQKLGELDLAIHFAKLATTLPDSQLDSIYYLGSLYMKKKDLKKAAQSFITLLKKDCRQVNALIDLATVACLQKKYERAKKYFVYALKIDPNNALASIRYGIILHSKLKDIDQAIQIFTKACHADPSNYKAFFHLAKCYIEKKDYDRAIQNMKKCLKINPKFGMASKAIGILEYEMNQPSKALKYFQDALENDKTDLEAKVGLGNCYYLQEQFDHAINLYEDISTVDSNEDLEFNLANCYYMKNQYDKAILHYLRALRFNSHKAECCYNLANMFVLLKRYEEAIDFYEKTIHLRPSFSAAYFNLGNAYYLLGKFDSAFESFELATASMANNVEWKNYVASLYMEQGLLKQARKHLDESVKLNGGNSETLYQLAWYYYQCGNYNESIRFARNTLQIEEHHLRAKDLIKLISK